MAREQVNFRVGGQKREKWDTHVEESAEYDKVSDLIKIAVRNQIERDQGDVTTPNQDFDIPNPSGGESPEQIEALRSEIEALQNDVSSAVDAVHAQEGVDPDVQPDAFDALPTDQGDATTAEALADAIGYRHATVRFALENMRRSGVGVKNVVEIQYEDGTVETAVNVDSHGRGESARVVGKPKWFRSE